MEQIWDSRRVVLIVILVVVVVALFVEAFLTHEDLWKDVNVMKIENYGS